MTELRNTTMVALGKAASSQTKVGKAARGALKVGSYKVNDTVQITGEITVKEDTEARSTSSILNVEFMLMVLKASGATREASVKAIEAVADDYLQNWIGDGIDKKEAKKARQAKLAKYDPEGKAMAAWDAMIDRLPLTPKKGACSFKGEIKAIEMPKITEVQAEEKTGKKTA